MQKERGVDCEPERDGEMGRTIESQRREDCGRYKESAIEGEWMENKQKKKLRALKCQQFGFRFLNYI